MPLHVWPKGKMKKTETIKHWHGQRKSVTHTLLVRSRFIESLCKKVLVVCYLHCRGAYANHITAISLLNIYSREMHACVHQKICIRMFVKAFFTVAPNLKQPKHPSIREWMN